MDVSDDSQFVCHSWAHFVCVWSRLSHIIHPDIIPLPATYDGHDGLPTLRQEGQTWVTLTGRGGEGGTEKEHVLFYIYGVRGWA